MFDFFSILLTVIGLLAVLIGIGTAVSAILDNIHAERERRRKHEQHLLTLLTRIADNTEPKS